MSHSGTPRFKGITAVGSGRQRWRAQVCCRELACLPLPPAALLLSIMPAGQSGEALRGRNFRTAFRHSFPPALALQEQSATALTGFLSVFHPLPPDFLPEQDVGSRCVQLRLDRGLAGLPDDVYFYIHGRFPPSFFRWLLRASSAHADCPESMQMFFTMTSP